jgi:uncharacterized membrane-anchored protein
MKDKLNMEFSSKMTNVNKVAQITLIFWLMKIIATTLGETLGDFISMTLNLGYLAGIIFTLLFFLIVLFTQLFSKEYVPVFYWLVIVGTTTLGTEISDFMDRSLHLGYALGSMVLFACLVTALVLWYQKFKSLKVYPIFERKKKFIIGPLFCFLTVWELPLEIS